jgi:ribonuclease P/MRP protein subunit RPP40
VCVYVRNDIPVRIVTRYDDSVIEAIIMKVSVIDTVLAVVYRPPDTKNDEWQSALEPISESIDQAQAHGKFKNLVVCGDFNLTRITWDQNGSQKSTHSPSTQEGKLCALISENFLVKVDTGPTRLQNCPDLFLTNNMSMFSHVSNIVNKSFSDHNTSMVFLSTIVGQKQQEETKNVYYSTLETFDISRADSEDWVRYRLLLNDNSWAEISESKDLDSKVELFVKEMEKAAGMIFPQKRKLKIPGNKIPALARKLMLRKAKLSAQLMRTCLPAKLVELLSEIESIESDLRRSLSEIRRDIENKKVAEIKDNPAVFYKYARKFSKGSASIGPLLDKVGNPVSDPVEMAEILSTQYAAMWTSPILEVPAMDDLENNNDVLSDVIFTCELVKGAITKLPGAAAPGPDGVAPVFLKAGGSLVISALTDIFEMSFNSGTVPASWKKCFVAPIWKGSDKSVAANYRPIALTSNCMKLMERVIHPRIMEHLERVGALDEAQHGARPGRSTLSQLLQQHEILLKLLENGDNVDIVYLDFSKAFDKVDIAVLLAKLKKSNIKGKLLEWIQEFLTNRQQAVRVGSSLSTWKNILSGIPQGSVMGSLMFLVYISDLGEDVTARTEILKFVDDTKAIAGATNEDEVEETQEDLNRLYLWQELNNMSYNDSKFQVLRMGGKKNLIEDTMLFTPGYADPIIPSGTVKDLGILMDVDCNFVAQREAAVAKTMAKCGWVFRTFYTREISTLRTLWRSLCEPLLDYGSALWSPAGSPTASEKLEKPLRHFTKRMKGLRGKTYWKRLALSNLSSFERRSERYKIIYAFKVAAGLVPNPGITINQSGGRRCGVILQSPSNTGSRDLIRTLKEKSFFGEAPKLFNSLPQWIRETDVTLACFKGRLDALLLMCDDNPRSQGQSPLARDSAGRPSNSIKDWIKLKGLEDWTPRPVQSS